MLSGNDLVIDSNEVIHLVEGENRVSLLNLEGEVLGLWGETRATPGNFPDSPHGVWMDSREDLYVCEVPFIPNRLQKFERV